jgi:hypothetical protein
VAGRDNHAHAASPEHALDAILSREDFALTNGCFHDRLFTDTPAVVCPQDPARMTRGIDCFALFRAVEPLSGIVTSFS